jgi:BirA family biotin operon repressor/biotin-[acetyl-CoA-carboxylase] ligase
MIIGIGMNLRNAKQIESLLGSESDLKVAALDQFLPAQSTLPDVEYLWLKLIASLEHHLTEFDQYGFEIYQEQWKAWDAYLGQSVYISGTGKEPIYGIAQGIDQAGALLLQQANQMIAIHAGDISLRVQT